MKLEERVYHTAGWIRSAGNSSIVGTIAYGKLSKDLGGFRERIKPGAFKTTDELRLLWQHKHDQPLASVAGGTLRVIDSPKCMTVIGHLNPDISYHRDALEAVKRKDACGLSFGFRIPKGGESWSTGEDGERVRELCEIKAHEFSIVTYPAYMNSNADVRKSITHRRREAMNLKQKREERNRIFTKIRELENKESLDTIEEEELRKLDGEYDELSADIKREELRERNRLRELELQQSQHEPHRPIPPNQRGYADNGDRRDRQQTADERRELEVLTRALSMDSPTAGGYLVLPQAVQNNVITKLKDELFILNNADVITVDNASSVSWPAVDHEPGDYSLEWTAELRTGSEDSTMDMDARQLAPKPLARRIRISKKLVRASGIDVVALVTDRMRYVFSTVLEYNFLRGNGVNKPLGIFTPSKHSIDTDRDVSTDNTATAIKADNLIECAYTLKAQYLKRARWCFHRDAMKMIRKLKDGEGNYLFQPQLTETTPAMLLGRPVDVSEYVPNTFTTGQYVGALIDWSFFKVVFALGFDVQILTELYAEYNQLGLIARLECDGMHALSESAVRVKLG